MRARSTARLQMLMLLPAALFLIALLVRNLSAKLSEPAHSADQFVSWYSQRIWTLWVLLLALPILALVSGIATLRHGVRQSPVSTVLVVGATGAATVILSIVILHMLAN